MSRGKKLYEKYKGKKAKQFWNGRLEEGVVVGHDLTSLIIKLSPSSGGWSYEPKFEEEFIQEEFRYNEGGFLYVNEEDIINN